MKKTVLIKLSGEAMSGKYSQGLDFEYIEKTLKQDIVRQYWDFEGNLLAESDPCAKEKE